MVAYPFRWQGSGGHDDQGECMATSLKDALEIVARTDPGVVRSHNEDAVFADEDLGLVVLADGIGGYNAGEVASAMAIASLSAALKADFAAEAPQEVDAESGDRAAWRYLHQRILAANSAIFETAESQPQYAGMGTTLIAAVFCDNRVTVAHLGDSRMYRLRGEVFSAVTRDHSLLQAQIDEGLISPEDARFSQHRNLVTRAIGIDSTVEPEIHEYDVMVGDIYLLCSDGLNDMVDDAEIGLALSRLSANLDLAASQLVQMANDNGGRDNISVILVRVLSGFPAARRWRPDLPKWLQ